MSPSNSGGDIATGNGIILFRASDPAQNAVPLILSGTLAKDAKLLPRRILRRNIMMVLIVTNDILHSIIKRLEYQGIIEWE